MGSGVGFGTVPLLSCSWSGSSCILMISSSFPGSKMDRLFCLSWGFTPWFGACFSFFCCFLLLLL